MDKRELENRTKVFAIRIIRLVGVIGKSTTGQLLGKQLLKSGTSIGANNREAAHASSRRQFITTLEIAQREAAETCYWIELIGESELVKPELLGPLHDEARSLLAILTASVRTAKKKSFEN